MMDNRYEWLARVFPELADTLVDDFDVVDFLSTLAERTAELLDATEVGLILADHHGELRVTASSTERMHDIELFELQNEEGPCHEALHEGVQVLNVNLGQADERWPNFSPRARSVGYRTVHALPMRVRDERIGAMNIFDTRDRVIDAVDVSLAQAFADVASIGILQARAAQESAELADNLQHALDTRVAVEQAKGIVAERLGVDMVEAFALLRGHARRESRLLADVVADVISHRLPATNLTPEPITGRMMREHES